MTWFWQQQIEYSTITGVSNVIRHTDWICPNIIDQNSENFTISTLLSTNHYEPKASTNNTYLIDDSYNNIYDAELKPYWNNLDNIKLLDDNYSSILSPNINPYIRKVDSPYVIARDFNMNISTGSTICGIEVKLIKSAYTISDNNLPFENDEEWYFDNNITHYTYDKLITLNLNSSYTNSTQQFNNYSKSYESEFISTDVIQNGEFIVSPNNYYISPAKNIWLTNKEISLYGGENDLWSNDYNITPDDLNSSGFSIVVGVTQHIFRGYTTFPTFNNIFTKRTWYKTRYIGNYDVYNMSYQVSKLYNIAIRVFYKDEEPVYNMIYREDIFNSGNTLKTYDTYFRFQQCFNGICYSYVNSLDNIYDVSLINGDGKSVNNMYNEYNIIDKYMSNLYNIDIATNEEIDLTTNHFIIDGVNLKPGHLVLLCNQNSSNTNDVYIVNNNYFLENSNILSDRDSSWRSIFYIKLGSNKEKQFFLKNEGNQFPIFGEDKTFIEGHSWIVKHKINYNIKSNNDFVIDGNNVLSNPCKMLFTDYLVARTQTEINDWNYIDLFPLDSNEIIINYLDNSYKIDNTGELFYSLTGDTTENTMFNWSGNTSFKIDSTFYSNSDLNDHIVISFKNDISYFIDNQILPNDSIFNFFTTIKNMDANYLIINGEIPSWFLNTIESGYTFQIRNIHYCNSSSTYSGITNEFANYLNVSPFADLINFSNLDDRIRVEVKEDTDYFRYFDFTLIDIINGSGLTNTSHTFTTTNQYQNYKLKPFLDNLGVTPTNIYNEAYLLSDEYTIEELDTNWAFQGHTLTDTYYPIQSSLYKIIPTDTNKLLNFKPYTYLDFGNLYEQVGTPYSPYYFTSDSGRTLIYEVTDEYMLIEKPRIDGSSGLTANTYDFINVSKLQDISDILYELYLKYTHSYYYNYPDNVYNKICSQYALILKENSLIRNLSTGILYQDDDLFNLDLFNIDINSSFTYTYDKNLTYEPIELIDVGIDKKTKLPYPLNISNLDISYVDNLYYTGSSYNSYASFPNSYLYTTTVVNDKLYVNIKYQGIYDFDNVSTKGTPYNANLYTKNNATLIFDSTTLSQEGLLYNYLTIAEHVPVYDYVKDIKSDIYNNTYHLHNIFVDNYNSYIEFGLPSATTEGITQIDTQSSLTSAYQSFLFMYSANTNEILTAITYKNKNINNKTILQDFVNIEGNNYVFISSDNYYYQKFNNEPLSEIITQTWSNNYTNTLIKYSSDFKTILWYKKFFATTTTTSPMMPQIPSQNIDMTNVYDNDFNHSLHIISDVEEDSDVFDNYIYASNRVPRSYKLMNINQSGIVNNILIETNSAYSYITLMKLKLTDGYCMWVKPIYMLDYSSIIQDSNHFLKKMIYHKNNIYMLIKAKGRIGIYNGSTLVEYGNDLDNWNIYVVKYDKDGNLQWVKNLGSNTDDFVTDCDIYDDIYGECFVLSGYYQFSTSIDSYILYSQNYGSFVVKLNLVDGNVIGLLNKTSTHDLVINSVNIVNNSIYIGGFYDGGAYFGGTRYPNNYTYCDDYNIFIEEIKINSF